MSRGISFRAGPALLGTGSLGSIFVFGVALVICSALVFSVVVDIGSALVFSVALDIGSARRFMRTLVDVLDTGALGLETVLEAVVRADEVVGEAGAGAGDSNFETAFSRGTSGADFREAGCGAKAFAAALSICGVGVDFKNTAAFELGSAPRIEGVCP